MLFDTNGFINPNENYDFAINIINVNPNTLDIYDKEEALKKGNLFKNLYDEYKNYKPYMTSPKNERQEKLLDIMQLEFLVNDLNLYLDIHPEDNYAYDIFKKASEKLKEKSEKYSKVYGPLELCDLSNEYEWTSSMFPWEGEF